ncbi:3-deoxy-7-phosphoheptulonate synthase [Nocardiopsis gilva YIM 90087]|uniref:Phospho-2-dehydro-3-deoxyheptonate aldolase n=1 Tax=Nocardiopsis gilva YIM 90087 TaxID=1235441 RepID=A0A223SA02_9ACTN|nr:3-deoxy-7-phosphoheptulonate synthase [Nocardiopsis gilva]ASU84919.1 3-deoxy-7-phosphoheptulonate synthase [Nocardiopsis gilva YIM 90087]
MTMSLNPTTAAAAQQPDWPDGDLLGHVRRTLRELPGLTTEEETEQLGTALAEAARGEALVLQGGDCAERFHDAVPARVRRKLDHLQGLASVLRAGTDLRVVPVGRMAGQYAKPRSDSYETLPDGRRVPSYRGDAVNDPAADPALRTADPTRLVNAYDCSRSVLRTLRASWTDRPADERVYTGHELLLLPYEESLVRTGRRGDYAASTHFGWIGARTRSLDGAHVGLAASVHNPIGVKIGPRTSPTEAVELVRRLNPDAVPGRLTFIVRMGAEHLETYLPPLVESVAAYGAPVVWLSDPMHGNTFRTPDGVKTRSMSAMRAEMEGFVRVLRQHRQWPAGMHLELTPDPVTECVDFPEAAADRRAFPDFRSACDPRLNPAQAERIVHAFLDLL